ncbi:MAG: NADP-dependent isocitrate dehydrogenase, partial [Candidatus Puniceispirillum sp.]
MSDTSNPDMIYTKVDEAPELASASLLPIINKFVAPAGLTVDRRDISLAGRIIAVMPDFLTSAQQQSDDLAELGEWVKTPAANVMKLPNISASIPQLKAAIAELQAQGYALPDYPDAPKNEAERDIAARYDSVKGSAVNPVLREGNSDRRSARAVKQFAMNNPHTMGIWDSSSKTHVSSMPSGDFFDNETSTTLRDDQAGIARIEFEAADGRVTTLKDGLEMPAGTVIDASFMCLETLRNFLREQLAEAKRQNVLFSVHLK